MATGPCNNQYLFYLIASSIFVVVVVAVAVILRWEVRERITKLPLRKQDYNNDLTKTKESSGGAEQEAQFIISHVINIKLLY